MEYMQIFYMSVVFGYSIINKRSQVLAYTSEFAQIVHTDTFVDKTAMIEEYYEEMEMVAVIAPEGFGKTTNMDMMRRYSEVVADEYGNRIPPKETENYKIFSTGDLYIFRDKTVFEKNFAKHAVIHLDFKSLSSLTYPMFLRSFQNLIHKEFLKHPYLINSTSLPEGARTTILKYILVEEYTKLKEHELYASMEDLCKMLACQFGTKCFLLIDDFDVPIDRAMRRYGAPLSEITHFLTEFLSYCARDYNPIKKMLINVCFAIEGIFHAANKEIIVVPFTLFTTFSHNYGFTESEVSRLLNIRNSSHSITDVRQWYNGYEVLSTECRLYNPFAVLKCLQNKRLDMYTSFKYDQTLDELFTYDLVREKIELIFEDYEHKTGPVSIKHIYMIHCQHFIRLTNIIKSCQHNNTIAGADLILQYLADRGFFNLTRNYFESHITIPNYNAKLQIEFRINTYEFYEHKFKSNFQEYYNLPKKFYRLDVKPLEFRMLASVLDLLYTSHNCAPYNEYVLQRHLVFTLNESTIFAEIHCDGRNGLFLFSKDDKVLIVQLRVGQESAFEALTQAVNKTYKHRLSEMRIHLGIHLSRRGNCTLSYLVNSQDLARAANITV